MIRLGRLCLMAAPVVAAMSMGTQLAFGAIEVKPEPVVKDKHCPAVVVTGHSVTGGCATNFLDSEDLVLTYHIEELGTEMVLSICVSDFEINISEQGEGAISKVKFKDPDMNPGACQIEACKENGTGAGEAWPFHVEDLGATEWLEVTTCIQAKASGVEGTQCTLHIPIAKLAHIVVFSAEPERGCEELGDDREFRGRWGDLKGPAPHTNIEIVNT